MIAPSGTSAIISRKMRRATRARSAHSACPVALAEAGRMIRLSLLAMILAVGCQSSSVTDPATSIDVFRAQLERLRIDGHIQAISAVIDQHQAIVWNGPFGGGAGPISVTTALH